MGRNHEVIYRHNLLKPDGTLAEPGWSKRLLQVYNREDIAAPKFKIKEWDYYLILNKDFAVALTLSDDGYIGMQSASFLCFDEQYPWEHTNSVLNVFPMGKYKFPRTSDDGDIHYHDKTLDLDFIKTPGRRHVFGEYRNFDGEKSLKLDVVLSQPPMDTMVIATPWKESKTAFYYNQKINCMRASGWVEYGGKRYDFDPETDFGTLDWGRGVWTYDNTWYWGSGNTVVNGKPFGFNIGYGFGDTSAASENILFYDGKAHKLDDVTFNIPEKDGKLAYTDPWTFTSSDGRFEMDFIPIIDRKAKIDLKAIVTDQHQVFGKMSGKAVLDDGTVIEIKDVVCFAEHVRMKY